MSRPKHAAQRPATFGDVFTVGEYRVLYTASALSWAGDYLARAAIAALVFGSTGSVALSAGTLAVGYLPWLTVGPFLSALAERYPKRTVMVTCDVARACIIAIVAIPGVPIAALFALLFAAALLNPPFDSARAALLPSILTGDRYVVGTSVQNTTNNLAMIMGYLVGGLVGSQFPHITLLVDAITFLGSAALVASGITRRPAELLPREHRTNLVRETAAGFQLVFASPILRAIVAVVLGASLLAIVPEGLAAAWAAHITPNADHRGLDQALIMMSVPVGLIVGALFMGRLVAPATRSRLIRPFALIVPIALTFSLFNPPILGVATIGVVVGVAFGGIVLPSNGLYVQALPISFRARGFGVVQFGGQLVQIVGLVVTGLLSDHFAIHAVVGLFGVAGIGLMVAVAAMWPAPATIDAAIEAAKTANDALAATDPVVVDSPAGPAGGRAGEAGANGTGTAVGAQRSAPRPAGWPSPRPGGRSGHATEASVGRLPDAQG